MRNLWKRHFFDSLAQLAERMLRHQKAVALIHTSSYANAFDDSKHEVKREPVSTESSSGSEPDSSPTRSVRRAADANLRFTRDDWLECFRPAWGKLSHDVP